MLVNLNWYGLISIAGAKPKDLLQGQLTCNMEQLPKDASQLAAHCNPKGRVISFFHLFAVEQQYYLFLPRHLIEIAMLAMQKYTPFFKTTVKDVTHEFSIYGSATPLKAEIDDFRGIEIAMHSAPIRYLILDLAKQINPPAHASHDWHLADLQAGVPCIYPETSQKYLPHELNLPDLGAVSLDKGCYTGQEIIARMHYRGKSKRKMLKAVVTTVNHITPGADIYAPNKRVCGSVIDYHHLGDHQYQLLILVDQEQAEIYLDQAMTTPLQSLRDNDE